MSWLGKAKQKISFGRTPPALPTIAGDEQTFEWDNHQIVYSVLGEGKPLLLLHGINAAAWRFEVRRNIEPLAQGGYKVFAPDMPGFGKSTRLAQVYTAKDYIAFIKAFAAEIQAREGQAVTIVASNLIAAHAIAAAAQSSELFAALLLICPTGIKHLAHPASEKQLKLFNKLSGRVGKTLLWLLTSRPSTKFFLARDAYYDKNYITKAIVEGYHRATRYPNAQFAPFSFITLQLSHNVTNEWAGLTQPAAIVWGDKATTLPLSDMEDFLRLRPDTAHSILTNTRLAPHDERAEEFNEVALKLLAQMQPASSLRDLVSAA